MTSNIRRPNKLYLHDLSLPSEQALGVLNLGTSCDRHDADPFLVQLGEGGLASPISISRWFLSCAGASYGFDLGKTQGEDAMRQK